MINLWYHHYRKLLSLHQFSSVNIALIFAEFIASVVWIWFIFCLSNKLSQVRDWAISAYIVFFCWLWSKCIVKRCSWQQQSKKKVAGQVTSAIEIKFMENNLCTCERENWIFKPLVKNPLWKEHNIKWMSLNNRIIFRANRTKKEKPVSVFFYYCHSSIDKKNISKKDIVPYWTACVIHWKIWTKWKSNDLHLDFWLCVSSNT